MTHRAFFGDTERAFALTPELIVELERKTNTGVVTLCNRFFAGQARFSEIMETIRISLIGGGTEPSEALALIETYGKPIPLSQSYLLALKVLETVWFGAPTPVDEQAEAVPQDEIRHSDAINDALIQVAP